MTWTSAPRAPLWGLPDPDTQGAFYEGVPSRRFVAWLLDWVVVAIITAVIVPFTAFTALFFLPVLFACVDFVYRLLTVASGSATWGMRLAGIELRDFRGEKLGFLVAAAHTFLYLLFLGMMLPLVVSVVLMLTSPRRQGLHDMLLGTAAIRRPA